MLPPETATDAPKSLFDPRSVEPDAASMAETLESYIVAIDVGVVNVLLESNELHAVESFE